MGNKSLPGSVDVQLKFYSQVKTSLKKGGRGGAPLPQSFCVSILLGTCPRGLKKLIMKISVCVCAHT